MGRQLGLRDGALRGEYEALLRPDEVARLRRGIAQLPAELKGNASFESMEEWLKMTGDGRGHFVATCEARDQPGSGNTLRFEQSELPAVIAALDTVLTAFPVKVSPCSSMSLEQS